MQITEDNEYQDKTIEKVEFYDDGCSITDTDGWTLFLSKEDLLKNKVEPKKGDTARFYGAGIGSIVRGVFINGQEIFYRTPEEQEAQNKQDLIEREKQDKERFEKIRDDLDADYNSLPENFKKRLDRFRRNNPDFRWKFEAYEMVCLRDAVKISSAFTTAEEIKKFAALDWNEQMAAVPDLDEGHSGNTFGFAVRLAYFNKTTPELVEKEHGAMCPLVGCKDYGCVPKSVSKIKYRSPRFCRLMRRDGGFCCFKVKNLAE